MHDDQEEAKAYPVVNVGLGMLCHLAVSSNIEN